MLPVPPTHWLTGKYPPGLIIMNTHSIFLKSFRGTVFQHLTQPWLILTASNELSVRCATKIQTINLQYCCFYHHFIFCLYNTLTLCTFNSFLLSAVFNSFTFNACRGNAAKILIWGCMLYKEIEIDRDCPIGRLTCHSGKSATIWESNHGSGVYK